MEDHKILSINIKLIWIKESNSFIDLTKGDVRIFILLYKWCIW